MSDRNHDLLSRRAGGTRRAAILLLAATLLVSVLAACDPAWIDARIDLRVLVFDPEPADEASSVGFLRDELELEGIPYDVIDLSDTGRAPVTAERLQDPSAPDGHAYYQAIILPDHAPTELTATELDVIHAFQAKFGIRSVAASVWPTSWTGGAHWPAAAPLYSGPLDGLTGQAQSALGINAPWLKGPVPIPDVDPAVDETWGYLAQPQPVDGKVVYLPLVTVPVPGTDQQAPILGFSSYQGYEELQLTATGNSYQQHARVLAPAIVDIITRGVHLGYSRNYFSLHIDDVFLPNDRWSVDHDCTPTEDCIVGPGEPAVETPSIRMTPAEVQALIDWQDSHDFQFDLAFNGFGTEQAEEQGPDALTDFLLANKGEFGWINHTYKHDYLGCLKDLTVRPWVCETDASGNLLWYSQAEITAEIQDNLDFAAARGIPIDPREIVTGEHSGMVTLPQQPTDSPYFLPALQATGIQWLASDNSREPQQRDLAPGITTVPRYPMNIFFNVATAAEEVDEYNWIYTSAANGGSGVCDSDPNSTCIDPLDPATGFQDHIIPRETSIALAHVLGNDPRPHYAHQSNVSEDQILLPVIASILDAYRSVYAESAPIVAPTQTEAGVLIRDATRWASAVADDQVTAYRQGHQVVVEVTGSSVTVPLTVKTAADSTWGEPYAGRRSAWTPVSPGTPLVVPGIA